MTPKNIHKIFIPPNYSFFWPPPPQKKKKKMLKIKFWTLKKWPAPTYVWKHKSIPLPLGFSAPQPWAHQPSLNLVWQFLCCWWLWCLICPSQQIWSRRDGQFTLLAIPESEGTRYRPVYMAGFIRTCIKRKDSVNTCSQAWDQTCNLHWNPNIRHFFLTWLIYPPPPHTHTHNKKNLKKLSFLIYVGCTRKNNLNESSSTLS